MPIIAVLFLVILGAVGFGGLWFWVASFYEPVNVAQSYVQAGRTYVRLVFGCSANLNEPVTRPEVLPQFDTNIHRALKSLVYWERRYAAVGFAPIPLINFWRAERNNSRLEGLRLVVEDDGPCFYAKKEWDFVSRRGYSALETTSWS